ncbi:MAG: molybdate ABC transporter substrate-binding protein [Armatimonadota bacterium]
MRRLILVLILVGGSVIFLWSSIPARQPSLVIFAGAASKPALDKLARSYTQKYGTKVEITYGGSGSVLTQFSQEHYGDVYVPGSDDFMDKAVAKGAVAYKTRTVLVYLVPVLSVAKGNPKKITGLRDLARRDVRVVVAEPKSVCLGAIAQEVLTKTSLWNTVKPRIATYATSCEDVLNHLLLGEADVVLGWDSFARQHPKQVQTVALPAGLTKARNVPAAMITWSRQPDKARSFIRFLAAPANRPVWQAAGYAVTAPARR